MHRILIEKFLYSPAKVNLFLNVLNKRKDSFHNIESIVLITKSLSDIIKVHMEIKSPYNTLKDALRYIAECAIVVEFKYDYQIDADSIISTRDNLVSRAVKEYFDFLQSDLSQYEKVGTCIFKFEILKKIPIYAGLGGGSSNAASVILFLNELAGYALHDHEVMNLCLGVGSDVPLFTQKSQLLYVQGKGDIIRNLPMNMLLNIKYRDRFLDPQKLKLFFYPPAKTKDTYQALDIQRSLSGKDLIVNRRFAPICSAYIAGRILSCYNSFTAADKEVEKRIAKVRREHKDALIGLSGSGSTIWRL